MRDAESFDAFYAGTNRRLLHQMYAMTGNLADAQELVQEAYARAWQRGNRVTMIMSGIGRISVRFPLTIMKVGVGRDGQWEVISPRISRAVSDGVLPTLTPTASRASFFAAAVPDEPDTIAPAWPIVLPSGAVKPAT